MAFLALMYRTGESARLDQYVSALGKVGLLTTLSASAKMALASLLSTEEYSADEHIVTVDEQADCMYRLRGKIHIHGK